MFSALKGSNFSTIYSAPSALNSHRRVTQGVALGYYISRLRRFHSAVRFTDSGFIGSRDPTDESVGYCHSSAARTDCVIGANRNAVIARMAQGKTKEQTLLGMQNFGWGMINGKLSALQWVLGDDWDMLDT